MSNSKPDERVPTTEKVFEAVKQSKEVAIEIKDASHDLAVAHAVLKKNIPHGVHEEDVGGAVERTAEVQKNLDKAAEKLETVNQKLERQLKEAASKK